MTFGKLEAILSLFIKSMNGNTKALRTTPVPTSEGGNHIPKVCLFVEYPYAIWQCSFLIFINIITYIDL